MEYIAFSLNRHRIEYDRNYGIDRRTGWTIVYDGSVLVELEPWLIAAIWKSLPRWRRIARWNKSVRV